MKFSDLKILLERQFITFCICLTDCTVSGFELCGMYWTQCGECFWTRVKDWYARWYHVLVWLFSLGDTVAPSQVGSHTFWPWRLIRFLSCLWYCLTGVGIWSDCLQMGFRVSLPSCLFPIALETRCVPGYSFCVTGNNPRIIWEFPVRLGKLKISFSGIASPGQSRPQSLPESLPAYPLWQIYINCDYLCK